MTEGLSVLPVELWTIEQRPPQARPQCLEFALEHWVLKRGDEVRVFTSSSAAYDYGDEWNASLLLPHLAPCPSGCGKERRFCIEPFHREGPGFAYVRCGCGWQGPSFSRYPALVGVSQAFEAWNKRTP